MIAFLFVLSAALLVSIPGPSIQGTAEEHKPFPGYRTGPPSADGTGRYFLGREIATVMGHRGAAWLERPERETEEAPDDLMRVLQEVGLKPGQVAADIGAGTGYFSWRLARLVGPEGLVYAVDIQPEMLRLLTDNMTARGLENVRPVLGKPSEPGLAPASVDLVLMVDVYHEFYYPYEMIQALLHALKSGGKLVFVEYRAEDPAIPIKLLHKMSEAQVKKEAALHSTKWIRTDERLPRQHVIVFEKSGADRGSVLEDSKQR